MGFQEKWFGLPILLLILFMANSITLTDSADNIHDFLGLNEPFFNPNIDSIFTAQEGGVAYLSCEVTLTSLILAIICTTILTVTFITILTLNTIFVLTSDSGVK